MAVSRVLAAFLLFLLSFGQAVASVYSFATAANSVDSAGEPVRARVKFSISDDSMVVTVINLQSGIVSVGQDISSLFFTVDSGGAVLSLGSKDLATSTGTQVNISSGGAVTSTKTVSPIAHWTAGSSGGQSYLNDLSGGGSPIDTIIGPPSSNGSYTTVNSSIAGNGPHNPFIQQQAVFTFNNPGLLQTAKVTNVLVGFGTTAGNTIRMIPEPGSLLLFALGLAFFIRPVSGSRK